MIKKTERFVASLTDREIDAQLNDIFEWAKVYKEILEKEKRRRKNNKRFSDMRLTENDAEDRKLYDEEIDEGSYRTGSFFDESPAIDYNLSQMIYRKVSSYSAEKTKEQLEKLKQLPTGHLSPEDTDELQFEIDTLELHLFELTGEAADSFVCPFCGAPLEQNAVFCGKCGKDVKGGM